jgi:hypothetical protein
MGKGQGCGTSKAAETLPPQSANARIQELERELAAAKVGIADSSSFWCVVCAVDAWQV